jgi:hypothetical protein
VYIPYVKGVSEKLKRIWNRYNIRTMFNTQHILRSSVMKTRPERDLQQTAQCIYSIPSECGRSRNRQTSSRAAPWTQAQSPAGSSRKIKISPTCLWRVGWDDARILEIESNSRYRRYKESAHIACLTNPISQSSLDISPIWIPLTSNEVSNSQRRSEWRDGFP